MNDSKLSAADLAHLAEHGIDATEATRQLTCLREGVPDIRLDRAATVGDGIVRLETDQEGYLLALHREAVDAGRCMKFVPASGAASRMFQSLAAIRHLESPVNDEQLSAMSAEGNDAAADALRFIAQLQEFPFAAELSAASKQEDRRQLFARLLDADAMGYGHMPKGLIPFHRYPDGPRSAFEEQLMEAGLYAMSGSGSARVHFTVSAEHRAQIEAHIAHAIERLGPQGSGIHVDYSEQHPSTDTMATTPEGDPFRDADGNMLLRPGGHGALLQNLDELAGDIVFLKNIDNVAPLAQANVAKLSKALLCGELLRVQQQVHHWLQRWETRPLADEELPRVAKFAAERLGVDLGDSLESGELRDRLRSILDRPIRACGMVRNEGEPGGGPYWVHATDGTRSLQIVEAAQIRIEVEDQASAMAAATHFNPVDLVCAVRDHTGQAYRLADYVDPSSAFIAEKSKDGKTLRALERPGLWNGAMAHWNTMFVELPIGTFTPVKTVLDLLRPEHQVC